MCVHVFQVPMLSYALNFRESTPCSLPHIWIYLYVMKNHPPPADEMLHGEGLAIEVRHCMFTSIPAEKQREKKLNWEEEKKKTKAAVKTFMQQSLKKSGIKHISW